jgi:hypothetical protein
MVFGFSSSSQGGFIYSAETSVVIYSFQVTSALHDEDASNWFC